MNFTKPNRPVTRVFIHCSASDYPQHDNVATMDKWHKENGWSGVGYHIFGQKSGSAENGRSLEKTPAAQGGNNRGTIAICLHGLKENKFTSAQKKFLIDICCQINAAYGGKVTFHGHCEVSAKSCPVLDYKAVLKLDSEGRLGVKSSGKVGLVADDKIGDLEAPEVKRFPDRATLRMGSEGPMVVWLQQELKELGYHSGAVDGDFGRMTRDAVLSFQSDNHLIEDAIVGSGTYEALEDAEKRELGKERKSKTVVSLASDGSRIAQASIAQGITGTALMGGSALSILEQTSGTVSRITEGVAPFKETLANLGPWVGCLVLVAGVFVVFQSIKAGRARANDHNTGKTL